MRRLLVLDGDGQRTAEAGQLVRLDAKPRWRDPGGWTVEVPPGPAADALVADGASVVIVADGVTVMSGPVVETSWGPDGTVSASGKDDLVWLAGRLALTGTTSPYPETLDYTGVAETVARTLVDDNAGPSADPARQLVTLEADQARGTSGTWKAKNQPLLDLLREIVTGEGWGLQVRWDDGSRVFRLLVPRDVSASVRLHDTLGAVAGWDRTRQRPEATFVYAAGETSAGSRPVSAGGVTSGWGRIETWLDVRSTAVTGELDTARDAELAGRGEVDSLEVELAPVGSFAFGVDYQLGDTVSVQAGGLRRLDTVVGVDVTATTVTPVLSGGRVLPALPSLGRISDLERRVTSLETS